MNTESYEATMEETEPLLRWFRFEHLAHPSLRVMSEKFSLLAHDLVLMLPRTPERTIALRKLLESKDAAVRAAVERDGLT